MNRHLLAATAIVLGSVPAPGALAQAPPPAAPAPITADGARPIVGSWTSDRRSFAVGDVITVLLDEYTLVSSDRGTFSSDRRVREASVAVAQNVTRAIPSIGADFGTRNDAESRQRGEATRQSRMQGEMSVRVVAVEPGGLLRVEGKKTMLVDRNREELVFRGWVRARDVSADNLVDSWRVGDAEMDYKARGSLGRPRGGIISRLIGALWP